MDWANAITAFSNFLFGLIPGIFTILGAWIANRHNERQLAIKLQLETQANRATVKRDKLEEVYSAFGAWEVAVYSYHSTMKMVMEEKLSYDDALDLVIKSGSKVDFSKIETLVHLYFPSSVDAFSKVILVRDQLTSLQEDFKQQYSKNVSGSSEHIKRLAKLTIDFRRECENFKMELAKLAASFIH